MLMLFFFFFRAEDGIRGGTVTGVQTCALPISPAHEPPSTARQARLRAARGCGARGRSVAALAGRFAPPPRANGQERRGIRSRDCVEAPASPTVAALQRRRTPRHP